jgi:hypothetical protein
VTAALSPSSFPQSSTGRLEVTTVLGTSIDQQGHGGQQFHVLFAFSIEGRFGDFLEQDMRLTVDHPIALADDGLPDGLGQMAFPGAGWTKKKCIFATSDERGRHQIEDQAPVHLLVEVEIEVVGRNLLIAKLRLFPAPFQQAVAATRQFIGY